MDIKYANTGIQHMSNGEPTYLRVDAHTETGIVGHLTVHLDDEGWFLYNILVYDTHRGQGIGATMLEYVERSVGPITRTNDRTAEGDIWWSKRK